MAIPLERRLLLDNISDLRSVVGSSPGRGQCRNFSNFSEKPPRTSGIATLYILGIISPFPVTDTTEKEVREKNKLMLKRDAKILCEGWKTGLLHRMQMPMPKSQKSWWRRFHLKVCVDNGDKW